MRSANGLWTWPHGGLIFTWPEHGDEDGRLPWHGWWVVLGLAHQAWARLWLGLFCFGLGEACWEEERTLTARGCDARQSKGKTFVCAITTPKPELPAAEIVLPRNITFF